MITRGWFRPVPRHLGGGFCGGGTVNYTIHHVKSTLHRVPGLLGVPDELATQRGFQPLATHFDPLGSGSFRPAGGEVFTALLNDHRSILKEMRRVLEKDGEDGIRRMVSEDPEYGDSLARLVKESRQNPKEL